MNLKTFMRIKPCRSLDSELVSQVSQNIFQETVRVLELIEGLLYSGLVLVCSVEVRE